MKSLSSTYIASLGKLWSAWKTSSAVSEGLLRAVHDEEYRRQRVPLWSTDNLIVETTVGLATAVSNSFG